MPEIFISPSIVLTGTDLGESDRLITFYTLNGGKIRGVAKGAKRSRHRFVNALEPFTVINLTLALPRTGGLARVETADIVENFPRLRERVDCYMLASLSCELVSLWTRESDPQQELFGLLLWYMKSLTQCGSPERHTLFYKTRLLSLTGYGPDFENCLKCGTAPKGPKVVFRPHSGGFLCESCARSPRESPNTIFLGTLRTLSHIQSKPLKDLERLAIPDTAFREAWDLVRTMHCHHLQRIPASYSVLAVPG